MEDQIKVFLSESPVEGFDYVSGYGDSHGSGDGSGYGNGSGSIYAYGYGFGYGFGYGSDSGSGYGRTLGYNYGDGHDNGRGDDVKMFNGDTVYMIDDVPTIIKAIHGNIAKGFILNTDFTLEETFVVKGDNQFAHGKTLHEAVLSLQEKLYDDSTEEERLEAFKEHFKDFSQLYPAKELFHWHHVLTGSCKQGREAFCRSHGIDLEKDFFTIDQFVRMTEDSYGGDIVKKLWN